MMHSGTTISAIHYRNDCKYMQFCVVTTPPNKLEKLHTISISYKEIKALAN